MSLLYQLVNQLSKSSWIYHKILLNCKLGLVYPCEINLEMAEEQRAYPSHPHSVERDLNNNVRRVCISIAFSVIGYACFIRTDLKEATSASFRCA